MNINIDLTKDLDKFWDLKAQDRNYDFLYYYARMARNTMFYKNFCDFLDPMKSGLMSGMPSSIIITSFEILL